MPRSAVTDLNSKVEQLNSKLKDGKIRLKIVVRGQSFYLRGMLPPKPGNPSGKKRQQYIAVGVKVCELGADQAYNTALRVWAQINEGVFNWEDWSNQKDFDSCGEWIARYRRDWIQQRGGGGDNAERFQNSEWKFALKWLPADQALTPELLMKVASTEKKPNTRARQMLVQALQRLAAFAELDVDLSPYKGTYSASKVKDRIVPSDELIVSDAERLSGKPWGRIFMRMMLYGLRDHEAFLCRVSSQPPYYCDVLEGKTGPRNNIIPAFQEWAEAWQLWEGDLPQVKTTGLSKRAQRHLYGERTARQFRRMDVDSKRTPYDYRHAYALRLSLVYGLSVPEAAQFMGHSPEVYLRIYSRHLQAHRTLENYQKLMDSDRRPKPTIT